MQHKGDRAEGIRLAYIGGGSRGWAWKFMTDLADEPSMSGEVVLYDIDREAAEANAVIGRMVDEAPETKGHWRYTVADTLEEALTGADFVVISILPGTFDEMETDVHMPERLGIWQSVGDTAGPGGMIRALRTLPMFVPIAEAVRDICPGAWVINYTNPMSLCMKVLYRVFPGIHAFGCCHEVFSTQRLLAFAAAEQLKIPVPERRDIHVNVTGINHFTWFTEASYKGTDLFPVYRDFTDRYFMEGFVMPETNWMNSSFDCAHRVKFDLFRRYGMIAAAGDRHLAEFMPGDQYLKEPETVRSWKFGLTPVSWRKADLLERKEKSRAIIAGERPVDREPSGEEGILLMKALCGLCRVISNVNLPNEGQAPDLPPGAVVETNAVFSGNSVRPVMAGPMPEEIRKLVLPHVENHERILEAAFTFDRELVTEAFLRDPNTAAKCTDRKKLRQLVDDMIAGTAAYLPAGWKEN